jgi:hypothetical protein
MLQKIRGVFREFGLGVGLLYGMDRALQQLSSSLRLYVYEFMVQPISKQPLVPARLTKSLEIREIRAGDPEIDLMPVRPEIKRARFEQNAVCLGAFQNGQFIAYMWFCYRAYEEDEVRCTYFVTPPDEAVFDFDLYIFPKHRLSLAFVGLWNGANRYLSERGIQYTFSRLTRFNVGSRRAHDHLGWASVGRAVFLQAWRAELMIATVFPYLHLSLRQGNRVSLKLRPDALLRRP